MTVNHRNFYEALEHLINEMGDIKATIGNPVETEQREDLIDLNEVCRLTRRAKPTIYRMTSRGEIPCYKNGKKLYFFRGEIMAWIRRGKKNFIGDLENEAGSYSHAKRSR